MESVNVNVIIYKIVMFVGFIVVLSLIYLSRSSIGDIVTGSSDIAPSANRHQSFSCTVNGVQNGEFRKVTSADVNVEFDTPLIYPVPKSVLLKKHDVEAHETFVLTPSRETVHVDIQVLAGGAHTPGDQHTLSGSEWGSVCSNVMLSGSIAEVRVETEVGADAPPVSILSLQGIKVQVLAPNSQTQHVEYWLSVDRDKENPSLASVSIVAYSFQGVLAAVSTLNQLVSDGGTESIRSLSLPLLIHDWSDSEWRGLMVDVVRHFIPMKLLRRTVDGMAAAKLNVLHMHLTDSQSFPVQFDDSKAVNASKLSKKAAFSTNQMYTTADLRKLVAYAQTRGVAVVPEIDMPAHARSWGKAFPEFVISCPLTSSRAENPSDIAALNPIPIIEDFEREQAGSEHGQEKSESPSMLSLVREMLRQVATAFYTSEYVHIGGDEVNFHCWDEDPDLSAWKKERELSNADIVRLFEKIVVGEVYKLNKIPILWQDSFDSRGVPSVSDLIEMEQNALRGDKSTRLSHIPPKKNRQPVVQPWKCWANLATHATADAMSVGFDAARLAEYEQGNSADVSTFEHVRSIVDDVIEKFGRPVIMSACDYLDFDSDQYELLTNEDAVASGVRSATRSIVQALRTVVHPGKRLLRAEGVVLDPKLNDLTTSECVTDTASLLEDEEMPDLASNSSHYKTDCSVENERCQPAAELREEEAEEVVEAFAVSSVERRLEEEEILKSYIEDALYGRVRSALDSESGRHSGLAYGGEACMWSESVDFSNFECRVWPRAAVVASRLWGGSSNQLSLLCKGSPNNPLETLPQLISKYRSYIASHELGVAAEEYRKNRPNADKIDRMLTFEDFVLECTSFCDDILEAEAETASSKNHVGESEENVNDPNPSGSLVLYEKFGGVFVKNSVPGAQLPQSRYGEGRQTELSKQMMMAYAHFRFYLTNRLKISAAGMTLHSSTVKMSSRGTTNPRMAGSSSAKHRPVAVSSWGSEAVQSEDLLLRRIHRTDHTISLLQQRSGSSNLVYVTSSAQSPCIEGADTATVCEAKSVELLRLTAQCPGISKNMQREIPSGDGAITATATPHSLKILQFNTENGSRGEKLDVMLEWLKKMANETVTTLSRSTSSRPRSEALVVAGFCELNDWSTIESSTSVSKNYPLMRGRAARAGFAHAEVLHSQSHPYDLGLMSVHPFEVLGRYGPPMFQRGLLHVYIKALELHVCVVHMHAHDSLLREKEASAILTILSPWLSDKSARNRRLSQRKGNYSDRIIVMGDLNTLSPFDSKVHEEEKVLEMLLRTDHSVFTRLRKKYTTDGHINYKPMQILLDGGLHDTAVEFCAQDVKALKQDGSAHESADYTNADFAWSQEGTKTTPFADALSDCMLKNSPFTEPTQHNPEWPMAELSDHAPHPNIRLDFILATKSVIFASDMPVVHAGVEISNITHKLSDHYPVSVSLKA